MTDVVLLGAGALAVALAGIVIGYAIGQALCRRTVRAQLWHLFAALDAEPQFGPLRWDVLNLIKRLEL